MKRLEYPFNHEWHVAINRHSDKQRADNKDWPKFMYEAKSAADEVPRMTMLFKLEREEILPSVHIQCSKQEAIPIKNNCLTCCLGVKTRECEHLLALEKIQRCQPEDIDIAKAWTCATHIISKGGDMANEGYLMTKSDRMYWDNVYESLSQSDANTNEPTD